MVVWPVTLAPVETQGPKGVFLGPQPYRKGHSMALGRAILLGRETYRECTVWAGNGDTMEVAQ